MPARKPQDLHTRHSTKAEIKERLQEESSMQSERPVPLEPPSLLGTNEIAKATWRRLMREYGRLEARIVSRLDMDLLIDYCIVTAQLDEMDKLRDAARELWQVLNKEYQEYIEKGKAGTASKMADKITKAAEAIIKVDARIDQKRKMLLTMRQSLYLTPRARAGVAPQGKAPEQVEDSFERDLNAAISRAGKAVASREKTEDGFGEGETE